LYRAITKLFVSLNYTLNKLIKVKGKRLDKFERLQKLKDWLIDPASLCNAAINL